MNENLTEKEQNNTFIKQTSFISSIDPNITTNHTFRIIKKRMPWSEEEDKSIKTLVSKYGTGNWTLISNEMGQNRSGKQCRERWYNQLKPNVKKNNWTNEEENILFTKHMQFGNKWSDIASFLPGRTLNDIKNHFYSKLRKFIRKILKQINDENLFKINGIDGCKYTGEKIYKIIKKHEITYKNLTKDTIFELIIATEKNPKGKFIFCNDFSNNDFNSYNYINNINNNFFDNNNINRDGNYNNQISYNNYLEISQEKNEINDKLLNEQNNNIINKEEMINDKIKKEKIVNYKDKNNIKKTKINKINNNKIGQLHNNNHSNSSKKNRKKSDINIQYNLEKKLKEDNGNNNNKLKNQKKKKNSSNKKNKSNDKNNHIGNNNLNYIFELNNKSKKNKYHQNQINKNLLLPNEMSENNNNICLKDKNKKKHFRIGNKNNEKSKDIIPKEKENKENNNTLILQSKTENKDNNNNFCFYPPFKVVTPKTSKHIQYPLSETKSYKSLKPEDFSFNYYDSSQMPQMFPANIENLLFNSQKNKNIFVTDLSFDNNLLKSRGSCLGSIKNDNTYKNFSLDGNLYNKLIMQSNMNMNNSINNNNNTIKSLDDNNLLEEKNDINIKKNDKPTINLDLINHQDFTNTFINGNMTGGNESQYNSIFNKNNPLNIYNSSPSSLKSLWK